MNVGGPYAAASGVNFSAPLGSLTGGSHTYPITVTDRAGHSATASASFNVASTSPTISQVVVAQAKGKMSWNVLDLGGVASSTLQIDGTPVLNVGGPYTAASGVNFSAPLGTLAAGNHTYKITATNRSGNSSSVNGNFNVVASSGVGLTISQVVVALTKSKMSWNVASVDTIASVGLTIDDAAVSNVGGPYAAATGANYSWAFGSLGAGTHTYLIRATDKSGRMSTANGSFTIAASSSAATAAVLSSAEQPAVSTSAKVDWLYDLGGLLNTAQVSSGTGKRRPTPSMPSWPATKSAGNPSLWILR